MGASIVRFSLPQYCFAAIVSLNGAVCGPIYYRFNGWKCIHESFVCLTESVFFRWLVSFHSNHIGYIGQTSQLWIIPIDWYFGPNIKWIAEIKHVLRFNFVSPIENAFEEENKCRISFLCINGDSREKNSLSMDFWLVITELISVILR